MTTGQSASRPEHSASFGLAPRAARGALIVAYVALCLGGALAGSRLFETAALEERRRSSSFALVGTASALQTKLQKFRLVPLALATDRDVLRALETPSETLRDSLNQRFEEIAMASDAAAIYLIDRRGVTFASSNYRSATSFVGQDYSFREYFQKALAQRDAQQFALGTVSGEPGLYLSRSITGEDANSQGVIVVKLRFNDIEESWKEQQRLLLVTDATRQIVVTSAEEFRFERLDSVEIGVARPPTILRNMLGEAPALATMQKVEDTDWTIVSFEPLTGGLRTARLFGALMGGSVAALLLGATILLRARLVRDARVALAAARSRAELEAAVAARTRELQESYQRLSEETARRERAQESVRLMQDEISQLNRLAIMGQFSAKVAHEINQPLTALRNYVDMSMRLLAAGDHALVTGNLETMSGLIMRAGRITSELRNFSSKRRTELKIVEIGSAVDGALLIAAPTLKSVGIALDRQSAADDQLVCIDHLRIEQVILNVIQNAIDALKDRPTPQIAIETFLSGDNVVIRISDNGPGVADPSALFTLFETEKEGGLGLGLSISRDILADFGGQLVCSRTNANGAAFDIQLPRSRS